MGAGPYFFKSNLGNRWFFGASALLAIGLSVSCSKEIEYRDRIVEKEVPVPVDLPPDTPNDKVDVTDTADNEIKVMAYNLENYFNAVHDADSDDWTYLPKGAPGKDEHCKKMSAGYYQNMCFKTDWNEKTVSQKTDQLARVVEGQGSLPDILGLEEVENADVAGRLQARLKYPHLLITTGSDQRGIDNVLMYRDEKLEI